MLYIIMHIVTNKELGSGICNDNHTHSLSSEIPLCNPNVPTPTVLTFPMTLTHDLASSRHLQ